MGTENYIRPACITPLQGQFFSSVQGESWNLQSIRFFSKLPTYFGSFTFLAIQYETRWAALLPTASKTLQQNTIRELWDSSSP